LTEGFQSTIRLQKAPPAPSKGVAGAVTRRAISSSPRCRRAREISLASSGVVRVARLPPTACSRERDLRAGAEAGAARDFAPSVESAGPKREIDPSGSAMGPQRATVSENKRRLVQKKLSSFMRLNGAAREIRTPDPIITNLTVLDFSGFPAHSRRHD
jgi:hypothetical protein